MAAPPLLLGHRGARAIKAVAENTLPSFDLAMEHGCDGFEFDVRLTSDGSAVVCHDATIGNAIICRTARNELPKCPVLDEVMRRYADRAFLDIELKVNHLETVVLNAIRDLRPQREYVVSSFLPEVLLELKARSAGVPIGLVCDSANQLAPWQEVPSEYVILERKLVSENLVEQLHRANRRVFVWTVNDPSLMRKLAGWGVDGIISDDTEILVKTLGARKAKGSGQAT